MPPPSYDNVPFVEHMQTLTAPFSLASITLQSMAAAFPCRYTSIGPSLMASA